MRRTLCAALISAMICLCGCGRVQRTMTVTSDPPGALVFMNDQEIGRTPLKRDFTWYGTYDVRLRMDGYQPQRTTTPVIAPWWQWPPIDLVVELLPGKWVDRHTLHYTLVPATDSTLTNEQMLDRAQRMRNQLDADPQSHKSTQGK